MVVGKSNRGNKGKKGQKKKTVDPFSRKDWYNIKAPAPFDVRDVGKTLVNRSQALHNANEELRGRVLDVSLADLKGNEDFALHRIRLRVDEVQDGNVLTNFHGMEIVSDKLRSFVRKWQTLIEAQVTVKTSDDYLVRLFAIAFTKRVPGQVKKTSYAQSSQVREIRKRMVDIMTREAEGVTLNQLVTRLIPEVMCRDIENECDEIYPLQNVHIRKVKLIKLPKLDLGALLALHGQSTSDDTGKRVISEFKDVIVESV